MYCIKLELCEEYKYIYNGCHCNSYDTKSFFNSSFLNAYSMPTPVNKAAQRPPTSPFMHHWSWWNWAFKISVTLCQIHWMFTSIESASLCSEPWQEVLSGHLVRISIECILLMYRQKILCVVHGWNGENAGHSVEFLNYLKLGCLMIFIGEQSCSQYLKSMPPCIYVISLLRFKPNRHR